jgi:hypothetical protein
MQRTQFNRWDTSTAERIALAATHGRRFLHGYATCRAQVAGRLPAQHENPFSDSSTLQQWILFPSAPLNGIYNVISTFVGRALELYRVSSTAIFKLEFLFMVENY